MKTFVTLVAILLAMVFVVPAFAGEEPFKAAVWNDSKIPDFHISSKLKQFTHWNTAYYDDCQDVLFEGDSRITFPECEPFGNSFICPSACRERFSYKANAVNQPEVCCAKKDHHRGLEDNIVTDFSFCPDRDDHGKTALITGGNGGYFEWVIALPKKLEGELNLEIQCGVLKPDSWTLWHEESINRCAAVTGEPIGPNCTRLTGQYLKNSALPKLEVTAHPGCFSDFTPFLLTAYKNPGNYTVSTQANGNLANSSSLQLLAGNDNSRIALKACMEKTVLIKWPVDGQVNVRGQRESNLQAGDLIKVKMYVPYNTNTVDLYCGKYSVTLGGIGEPETLLDDEDCDCISDADCQW